MTIGDALRAATRRLERVSTSPALDAELLCGYALGVNRSGALSRESEEMPETVQQVFAMLVQQRADGMPVAYIRGEQEFYGRSFVVNRSVLIPRPETEMLVEAVKSHYAASTPLRILDIGTGSGCIAVTLALEFPQATVVATDIDGDALIVAERNAERLGAQVEFRRGDCYEVCRPDEQFDVVVSNPPYVRVDMIATQTPTAAGLRYEPIHALTPVGPTDKDQPAHTSIVEHIIIRAPQWLVAGGMLVVEIGEDMGAQALQWARAAFVGDQSTVQAKGAVEIKVVQEWSGHDRMLVVHNRSTQ